MSEAKQSRAIELTLSNGGHVMLRPINRDDGPRLQMGLDHLSVQSRYLRFFSPLGTLSKAMIDRLTDVDGFRKIAWGAIDLSGDEAYPVGVARCIRKENEPATAELAVAVIDSHQHRGLACLLLAAVAYDAAQVGIESFYGEFLSQNQPMRQLLQELGAHFQLGRSGVSKFDLSVHSDAMNYPDSPGKPAFCQVFSALNQLDS